ncbi:MAG TPA: cupredoxin domain-containing protein [Solirubrobacterales bacterium]|nr:cupredoxin domain-containing protein [Solirubrobacterales bacterium]
MIRKHPALLAVAVAALVAAFALAACGDDDDDDTGAASETTSAETTTQADEPSGGSQGAAGGGETIAISETDYELDPAEVRAPAGEITFELTNDGQAPHNLEVEGNGVEEVSETMDAGQRTDFTVSLDPGTYTIYCAIDGHRQLGMEGELTVE